MYQPTFLPDAPSSIRSLSSHALAARLPGSHAASPVYHIYLIVLGAVVEARRLDYVEFCSLEEQLTLLRQDFAETLPQAIQAPSVTQTPEDQDFYERFLAELHQHISHQGYSSEQLCRALCTSKSRLHPRIKCLLGTTPMKYLQRLRLAQAARLLRSTPDTVEVIAEQCGFCSGSHLSERFKERYGCTPGAWRELGGR